MRQPILPALLVAFVAGGPAIAAPADFGLPQGYPYNSLAIDVELTKSRGGGQELYPYFWLSQTPTPNPGWDEVAIVATPQTGVCGLAAYAFTEQLPEGQWQDAARKLLAEQFTPLKTELGRFLITHEGEMVADYSVDDILLLIEEMEYVMFYSAAENLPSVQEAGYGIRLHEGILGSTYQMAYQNADTCREIIQQ